MMINRNRNKEELSRLRSYPDPDDKHPPEPDPHENDVKWFGIWIPENAIIGIGFGIVALVAALQFGKSAVGDFIGLPMDDWRYSVPYTGFLVLLAFVALSMITTTRMKYQRELREVDERTARRDNATAAEVAAFADQSEKRRNRGMWWRSLLFVVALVALFPFLGTKLIFPWGNILIYAAAGGLLFAVVFIWWRGRAKLAAQLRRLAGRQG